MYPPIDHAEAKYALKCPIAMATNNLSIIENTTVDWLSGISPTNRMERHLNLASGACVTKHQVQYSTVGTR